MKKITGISWAIAALLSGSVLGADAPSPPTRPALLRQPLHDKPAIPLPEPAAANQGHGFGGVSAFAAPAATGTTLTGPATLSYSGSSNALTITNSGSNRGISAVNSNTNNGSSALFGETYGSGAGLTGYNAGTSGPGGKFQVTNANSAQPGAFASTNGTGPAILGTITTSGSNYPAVYGQNTSAPGTLGLGVEGDGNFIGVDGNSPTGYGVYGYSSSGGIGVEGQAYNSYGVYGQDLGSGVGVYGFSENGNAGQFDGNVVISGVLTVRSITYSSDRAIKTDFAPINAEDLLQRIDGLPITSWRYKTEPGRRHVGPMAQDFHAAFGLNGDDNTHISAVDAVGVSFAAIQELHREMNGKDKQIENDGIQIAALRAQLAEQSKLLTAQTNAIKAMSQSFAARLTAIEQRDVRGRDSALTKVKDAARQY